LKQTSVGSSHPSKFKFKSSLSFCYRKTEILDGDDNALKVLDLAENNDEPLIKEGDA
jgi:hypothetical protein